MKKNIGSLDKILRLTFAVIVAALYAFGILQGTLGIVLLAAAGVLIFTNLINFCPLYAILGVNTCGKACDSTEEKSSE